MCNYRRKKRNYYAFNDDNHPDFKRINIPWSIDVPIPKKVWELTYIRMVLLTIIYYTIKTNENINRTL